MRSERSSRTPTRATAWMVFEGTAIYLALLFFAAHLAGGFEVFEEGGAANIGVLGVARCLEGCGCAISAELVGCLGNAWPRGHGWLASCGADVRHLLAHQRLVFQAVSPPFGGSFHRKNVGGARLSD